MICPSCKKDLVVKNYEGVEIDLCENCKGVWLDNGELSKIVEIKEVQFSKEIIESTLRLSSSGIPDEEIERKVLCPKCQTHLNPVNCNYSSGVIIDRCPKGHGLWLDGDELEKVQAQSERWEEKIKENHEEFTSMINQVEKVRPENFDEKMKKSLGPVRSFFIIIYEKIAYYLE